MTGNAYSTNFLSAYFRIPSILIILFSTCMLVFVSCLAFGYPIVISLSINKETAPGNDDENVIEDGAASLQIVKVVPFNDTAPSSITVDTLRNLVYVSVNPGYPYN